VNGWDLPVKFDVGFKFHLYLQYSTSHSKFLILFGIYIKVPRLIIRPSLSLEVQVNSSLMSYYAMIQKILVFKRGRWRSES
jgi:hypothetical protein